MSNLEVNLPKIAQIPKTDLASPFPNVPEPSRGFSGSELFNIAKSDYENTSLLLGEQEPGLYDSINTRFPKIFERYLHLKSIDWPHTEFPFDSCKLEFKTCSPSEYQAMIRTIAWQWEADSLASRSVAPLMACFNPCSELWAAYCQIGTNEVLHALTYSEIVRNSFDDPGEVIKQITSIQQAFRRMETVSKVFHHAYQMAHKYALKLIPNDQQLYNAMYLTVVAMYLLERCQFPSSFVVTFSMADNDLFIPIGKAVQKIAADELEVHAEVGRLVLEHEHSTQRGRIARIEMRDTVQQLFRDVGFGELAWNKDLLSEGRQLTGLNQHLLDQYTLFNMAPAAETLHLIDPMGVTLPTVNPLPFMDDWLDISRQQAAVQEQQNGQYKTGLLRRDDEGMIFGLD